MTTEQDVSWDEIELLVEKLSRKISKLSQKFSSITTLSRGVLVSSCLLTDHLGIEIFLSIKRKYLLIQYLLMIFLILEKLLTILFLMWTTHQN
ncbi:MAG: hypothetical protein OEM77_01055 [Nitrosopumilus sp.]|nr:hypothetical protein [Nitrosopumilus sp.]MDH3735643.1 hypothetical protein [Nitrosopumilus sp.]MDH3822595.1 hypothetical protein [Nitrosopumilus sp.]MDH3833235.1 hypothetical protein [Nitrosopumilus sp.]